jgi:nucleoside 2-deoxyribosyltransferase
MKHYIYLAGPITGLTYEDATLWRELLSEALNSYKIECLSPLRGKDYLLGAGVLTNGTYDGILTTGKAITRRDYFDCTRASCVLVNLLGTTKISIGTVMEIAWAYEKGIPTVVIMEKNNIHNHVMLNECSTYVVGTLEEATETIRFLFNEGSR